MAYVDDGDLSYGLDSAPDEPTADEAQFYGEPTASAFGFAIEHLRILAGPICEPCWLDDDALAPATENHSGTDYCVDCYSNMAERAHEAMCEDFYGGSGPSDQGRFEARRDSGRRA